METVVNVSKQNGEVRIYAFVSAVVSTVARYSRTVRVPDFSH
jgi:hypothetical protein